MIKRLFYLFIFFAPFTSFFALSAWLRMPVIINQLLFLVLIIGVFKNNRVKTKWIVKEDLFLLVFFALVWLSFLFGFLEKRSFNHSLAYTNSILFYFFLSKYVIELFQIPSIKIAKVVYRSFAVCSFIMIVDFIGRNYFNVSLRQTFSEADGAISNMDYFIRTGFRRVGGVAEEPGHMAMFYNIYFGISLYYISLKKQNKSFYVWVFSLFIVCQFMMFSNAGIILPVIAGIFIFSINKLKRLKITPKQILIVFSSLVLVIIVGVVILFFDIGNTAQIFEEFFDKVFFNESDNAYSSSGQRLKQWSRALKNFTGRPLLGNGPGFGVNEDPEGYLSVYLTILSDVGIIALLFFLSFQERLIRKVMSLDTTLRSCLLFSVITSFLHLIIIADFYHAPLWILFVFIQLIYKEKTALKL